MYILWLRIQLFCIDHAMAIVVALILLLVMALSGCATDVSPVAPAPTVNQPATESVTTLDRRRSVPEPVVISGACKPRLRATTVGKVCTQDQER